MKTNLEDQIIEELGTQMQSEIDKEILWGMLQGMGWTRVNLDRFKDNKQAVDIINWLEKHCNGPFERKGRDFIFEDSVDAVNFIMRWQ
jgi:hypothetical protein